MSKRNYGKYEEDEVAHKYAKNENHLSSHKRVIARDNLRNTDPSLRLDEREISKWKSSTGSQRDRRRDSDGNVERFQKIAALLGVIDGLLNLDSEDSSYISVGWYANVRSQCRSLQKTLREQRVAFPGTSTLNTLSAPTLHADGKGDTVKDLRPLSWPLSLTPWSSSSIPITLPPLPAIRSPDLEMAAFTHCGMTSNTTALSYERLEWVGDAYIYFISTLLISSTFTSHSPGKSSQIRELLVKNETLASYARYYGFENRARLPPEFSANNRIGFKPKEVEKRKVLGDIFEAYVAAIILSDPEEGVNRVSLWLKELWAETIWQQIKEQEQLNEKVRALPAGMANVNPKDILSRKIGAKDVRITYRDIDSEEKDPVTGFPLFTIGVFLDGWGENGKQLGIGKGLGKRDAGMRAAEMALANEKLMSVYGNLKISHDEKLRVEKEKMTLVAEGSSHTVSTSQVAK